MNSKEVSKHIKQILDTTSKEKAICIFIDGQWGIGKTYSISDLEKERIKYISVFGKTSVDNIRKELVLEIKCTLSKKINDSNSVGINILKNKLEESIGVKLDTIIDTISIEKLDNEKDYIVIIDDIERKSKNIDFIELLGLIERISEKFKVIAIGSTSNLIPQESELFRKFKEKVIDYEFIIDDIDKGVIIDKINEKYNMYKEYYTLQFDEVESIVKGFNLLNIKNLRILGRYLDLLFSLNREIAQIKDKKKFWLNLDMITICSSIIKENYLYSEEYNEKHIGTYEYNQVYQCIENFYKNYTLDKTTIREYLSKERDIDTDIDYISKAYLLYNEEKLNEILNKIYTVIRGCNNNNYFKSQTDLIKVFEALMQLEAKTILSKKYYDNLLKISDDLYNPYLENEPKRHDEMDWMQGSYATGISPIKELDKFIADINESNIKKQQIHVDNSLDEALTNKKYENIKPLLSNMDSSYNDKYKEYFIKLFKEIDNGFNEDIWNCLIALSIQIDDIEFLKSIECEGYVNKSRIKYLEGAIEEDRYFRSN